MCLQRTPTLDIWKIKNKSEKKTPEQGETNTPEQAQLKNLWPFLAVVEALQATQFTPPEGMTETVTVTVGIAKNASTTESISAQITLPTRWGLSLTSVILVNESNENSLDQVNQDSKPFHIQVRQISENKEKMNHIEGELYQVKKVQEGGGVDCQGVDRNGGENHQEKNNESVWKWRPWWMCDCWLNETDKESAQKSFFGITTDYTGIYALNTAAQKTRVALRDFVLANSCSNDMEGILNCPWTGNPLLHRRESTQLNFEFNSQNKKWEEKSEPKRAIYVHEPPSIDHLVPSSIVLGENNKIQAGNNLIAVSPRANMLKADWYPTDIQDWCTREKYSESCSRYVLTRANQKQGEDSFTGLYEAIFATQSTKTSP